MKKKMIDVYIRTTHKAKCGSKGLTVWIDFSNTDAGMVQEMWEAIHSKLGIDINHKPHCKYLFEELEMLARMGYLEYFNY